MGEHEKAAVRPSGGGDGSWRDRVRGVFFRVAAEAWVETAHVGSHQWGWRLRSREGSVIRNLNGRHDDRDAAFEAAVRFFERRSAAAGDFGRFRGDGPASAGATSGPARKPAPGRAAAG